MVMRVYIGGTSLQLTLVWTTGAVVAVAGICYRSLSDDVEVRDEAVIGQYGELEKHVWQNQTVTPTSSSLPVWSQARVDDVSTLDGSITGNPEKGLNCACYPPKSSTSPLNLHRA